MTPRNICTVVYLSEGCAASARLSKMLTEEGVDIYNTIWIEKDPQRAIQEAGVKFTPTTIHHDADTLAVLSLFVGCPPTIKEWLELRERTAQWTSPT